MKALGFVEVVGVVAAVDCIDIMCKSAAVSLVTWERKLGGRLVTVIVQGSVSDVTEAVECAKRSCIKTPAAAVVIANPHEEVWKMLEGSVLRHHIELTGDEALPGTAEEKAAEAPVPEKPRARTKKSK